jgi:MYXO-CTERM domain-containing protein
MKARPLAGALVAAALGSVLLASCTSDRGAPQPAQDDAPEGRAASALAAPAALPGPRSNGRLPGMIPFRSGPDRAGMPVCASPQLAYFGGPLLQAPLVVAVFWSSAVNASVQANMAQFYADAMQSPWWTMLQEYDSVGQSPGSNQAILPGTSTSAVITPLLCAPGGKNCKLTDQDLQNELARQIGLGVLPAPTLDCTGNASTLYMIHFPPNISLEAPMNEAASCVNMGFCGYHYTGTYGPNNIPLVYGALMDVFTGPCALGCGGNAAPLDNATDLASHELAEATTDTDVGLIPSTSIQFIAPGAWYDVNNNCGEVADICADGSPGDTITVSGRSWVVQELWSNQQGQCASSGPPSTICSGTTVTGCRQCSCGDNGKGCTGATPVCETSSSNVLYGGCEQCTSTNACTTGTCQQSTTPSQDDICSSCTPITACPAGDDCGSVSNGCGGMITCGTCTAPQTCGGGNPGTPNVCGMGTCTPKTCAQQAINCGPAPDGCGNTLNCGTCTPPQTCGGGGTPGVCGAMCNPETCAQQGFNCGQAGDGCGDVLNCGTCTAPQTCGGAGKPNVCGSTCVPQTCAELGLMCGPAFDGCGHILNCGACPAGQFCGGSGKLGVCGAPCLPKSCAQQGFNCGTATDGCNNLLGCGTCMAPEICGGGGAPNVCGPTCVPETCVELGANCGAQSDGCGNVLECGTCAPPETCGGGGFVGVCGCSPLTTCPGGANCGTAPDGCGGVVTCGVCPPSETCGGGGIANLCGCMPVDMCPTGFCGALPDGCGGTLDCGCAGDEVCVTNVCVSEIGSSSSSASSSSSGGGTGGGSSSTSNGAGGSSWPLIYGRASCSVSPSSDRGPAPATAALLGLAGLAGLARRRRRSR